MARLARVLARAQGQVRGQAMVPELVQAPASERVPGLARAQAPVLERAPESEQEQAPALAREQVPESVRAQALERGPEWVRVPASEPA